MVINGLSALRTVFFFSEIMPVCAHRHISLFQSITGTVYFGLHLWKSCLVHEFFLHFVKISEFGHLLNQFHCFLLQGLCPLRHQMEMMDLHFWKSLPLLKNSLFPPRIHHPGGQSFSHRRIVSKARDLSFAAGFSGPCQNF